MVWDPPAPLEEQLANLERLKLKGIIYFTILYHNMYSFSFYLKRGKISFLVTATFSFRKSWKEFIYFLPTK